MKPFQIKNCQNSIVLYEGKFLKFRHCVEQAVRDGVLLEYADFTNRNLANVTLDDADMPRADFSGCNLTGANLSEARLRGANFSSTDLYNTCLASSDLRGANFQDASFGATDVTGADISHSIFSTLSCFSLEFGMTALMDGCVFTNPDGVIATMSNPFVVIRGASSNIIIFMDNCVKIDHEVMDYKSGIALLKKQSEGIR